MDYKAEYEKLLKQLEEKKRYEVVRRENDATMIR